MAAKPTPPSHRAGPRRGRPKGKAGAAKTPTSMDARRRPPQARATARQPTQSPARRARPGKTPSARPSPRGAARTEAIAAALQQLHDQLSALSATVQTIAAKLDAALPSSRVQDPDEARPPGAPAPSP